MRRLTAVISVGPTLGIGSLYLDGALVRTVDCYATSASDTFTVYVGLVDDADHEVTFTATGSANPLSSGTDVYLNSVTTESAYGDTQMATFNKFNSFVEAVAEKAHNLGSDQIVVALCAAANAPVATDAVLADLTEIAYTNLSSRNVTTSASAQSSGTYKLTLADLTLTATGGAVAAFRYVVLYNDTATNDELIGWYDYGSDYTIPEDGTFVIDFDGTNGVLTIA